MVHIELRRQDAWVFTDGTVGLSAVSADEQQPGWPNGRTQFRPVALREMAARLGI